MTLALFVVSVITICGKMYKEMLDKSISNRVIFLKKLSPALRVRAPRRFFSPSSAIFPL